MNTIEKAFIYLLCLITGALLIFTIGQCVQDGQNIVERQIRFELKHGPQEVSWIGSTKSIDLY
jgi:hypothetical protein